MRLYLVLDNTNGDWGLGIGDWGLGIGPNPQSPLFILYLFKNFSYKKNFKIIVITFN